MQNFIARQNIELFTQLLKTEQDPTQRKRLEAMLAEERAKLTDDERQAMGAIPSPGHQSSKHA